MSVIQETAAPYRLTEEEISQSRLAMDDLRILAAADEEESGDGVRCEGTYCEKKYSSKIESPE